MKAWWKRILDCLKAPNALTVGIALSWTVAGIVGSLIFVFIGYMGWLSYVVYALSACLLAYSSYVIVRFAPHIKRGVQNRLRGRKFTRNLTESYAFRTLAFAACSFVVNIGFVLFNTVLVFLTGNPWYGALAGYYFLLSLLRGGVFWKDKRAKSSARGEDGAYRIAQLKNYRLCGVALLTLEVAMAVAVAMMVLGQKPTQYGEIMAIVFAAYSFYKISFAVWNIVKAKRTRDMQVQSLRNIGLADAAISLLSLQVTLVATFSEEGADMTLLNAMTGACVCLLTMGLGIFMIVVSTRRLRVEKENKSV